MSKPEFFQQTKETILIKTKQLAELESKLNHCYKRWDELA